MTAWPPAIDNHPPQRSSRRRLIGLTAACERDFDAVHFITHRFDLDEFIEAYHVFADATETGALKVVLHQALKRRALIPGPAGSDDPPDAPTAGR